MILGAAQPSRGIPVYWEGTRPGKGHIWHICFWSGSLHSSSSLCDLSLHLGFCTVVFQMKNVSVLYLLARKCQVFSANDMKVLEIYFESEVKNMYWIIFLMCFLGKVMCNCKNENTLFPAQKMIIFKMYQTKTPKNSPKPEYIHLGTVWCQFCAKPWPKLNLDISAHGLRVLQVTWNETVEICVNRSDFVYNYSKQASLF